jgi:hypothetical protein
MMTTSRRAVPVLAVLLAAACQDRAPNLPVKVDGARLVVTRPDGSRVADEELPGATLAVRLAGGERLAVRIDSVERDAESELVLYGLSAKDATGAWQPLCPPDAQGRRRAIPLAGVWTADGRHLHAEGLFELACTSDAIGKCARMGYHPWKSEAAWDMHQACTRMVRADYCGDGVSHTRDGMRIDLYDRVGIQKDEPEPGMRFEAAWGKDGAVCVARPRLADGPPPAEVVAACPQKLQPTCTEEASREDPRALLFNKS